MDSYLTWRFYSLWTHTVCKRAIREASPAREVADDLRPARLPPLVAAARRSSRSRIASRLCELRGPVVQLPELVSNTLCCMVAAMLWTWRRSRWCPSRPPSRSGRRCTRRCTHGVRLSRTLALVAARVCPW